MFTITYTYTNGKQYTVPVDANSEWAARNIFKSYVHVSGISYTRAELKHNGEIIDCKVA